MDLNCYQKRSATLLNIAVSPTAKHFPNRIEKQSWAMLAHSFGDSSHAYVPTRFVPYDCPHVNLQSHHLWSLAQDTDIELKEPQKFLQTFAAIGADMEKSAAFQGWSEIKPKLRAIAGSEMKKQHRPNDDEMSLLQEALITFLTVQGTI